MLARSLGAAQDDMAELLASPEDQWLVVVQREAVLFGDVVLRQHEDFPTSLTSRTGARSAYGRDRRSSSAW